MGLILSLFVHPADIQDRDGAKETIKRLKDRFPRLRRVWADGGYRGKLVDWVSRFRHFTLEIVERLTGAKGFAVLPHRWVVERTFGWFGRYRRLSKDYEFATTSSETMIYIAMTQLMLHRLAPAPS
jgi:putative transposase